MSDKVKQILSCYESENPGVKANLTRILMHGKLGGTGKLVILPVDQGFEHGPLKSFEVNPDAYDPHYHFQLAVDSGVSAYAAPLGMIEAGASTYAGMLPLILKLNSSNSLHSLTSDQAITASVKDALRLGCTAVGFTIYPGSAKCFDMIEEAREIIAEAKSCGLAVVLWSYPRGEGISKEGETAVDVIAYAAHIAALLGANIIKVKLPTNYLEKEKIEAENIEPLFKRIEYVRKSCFAGKRIVVFSGGESKGIDDIYNEAKEIKQGGGNGSIIGRNTFQRKREEALSMLREIMGIYT
ncbi:class I fructose-bisphosphate aldolase [Candidatus Wolbachia massiliensis]|uniref:fructose-bisphosphate aldolase n=1 Tax=Candidatus Wolbachia massiliensis TaxID=1845000 RepID=A0A7M3U356_9RICK|nr:class I fructose-bisphosphate aldolase [Candidatus Wolbachia massiliensis]QOD38841.1 class I fructose-bisphosphate aldolase [Candidatus Wolbachia massiliensis]